MGSDSHFKFKCSHNLCITFIAFANYAILWNLLPIFISSRGDATELLYNIITVRHCTGRASIYMKWNESSMSFDVLGVIFGYPSFKTAVQFQNYAVHILFKYNIPTTATNKIFIIILKVTNRARCESRPSPW